MVKWAVALVMVSSFLMDFNSVDAAAKKRPAPSVPFNGKKALEFGEIPNVQIDLPNSPVVSTGGIHNFGDDFHAALISALGGTGRFTVTDPPAVVAPAPAVLAGTVRDNPPWQGSTTPVAKLRIGVDALTFVTGNRGDRMFYGFDENFKNPFNRGDGLLPNEFPLKTTTDEPSWFGNSFVDQGNVPVDSRSGLDLGEGLSFNFLFAWLTLKYASYHSDLHLKLYITYPNGAEIFHEISVSGSGYYFDVVGQYQYYSLGIMFARTDAMQKAFNKAMSGTLGTITSLLDALPMVAKVDWIDTQGQIYLGTGFNSQVRAGTLYAPTPVPTFVVKVTSTVTGGSIAKVVAGDPAVIQPGMILQEINAIPSPLPKGGESGMQIEMVKTDLVVPASSNSVQLSKDKLAKVALPAPTPSGWSAVTSGWQAFVQSLEGFLFLPYRIYRYLAYDLGYHRHADPDSPYFFGGDLAWTRQIGLDVARGLPPGNPVVAIIDSGVDYNHPVLHQSLWMLDSQHYGWDFISNDSHPYDDGYHGTQLASLVVRVASSAKIMPLKVFNPWGVTTSASIYGAFQYAADHGAHVILCGWSTARVSKALEMGVGYARDQGIPVVAAAGDLGWNLDQGSAGQLSYPAKFSNEYANVVSVTGVDLHDRLVHQAGAPANFGPHSVMIAAPGQDLSVAQPRSAEKIATSTGLAAAIVAGALARQVVDADFKGNYVNWIQSLLADADGLAALDSQVAGGRRLRVK